MNEKTNQETRFDIFNYKNLGSVRCYVDQQGMKWFCHGDVCNILQISDPSQTLNTLERHGVISNEIIDLMGIARQETFVDQGNLFILITGSSKPEAREFTNWVCDTVLPNLMNKVYYAKKNEGLLTTEELMQQMSIHVYSLNQRITSLEEWKAEANKLLYTLRW